MEEENKGVDIWLDEIGEIEIAGKRYEIKSPNVKTLRAIEKLMSKKEEGVVGMTLDLFFLILKQNYPAVNVDELEGKMGGKELSQIDGLVATAIYSAFPELEKKRKKMREEEELKKPTGDTSSQFSEQNSGGERRPS